MSALSLLSVSHKVSRCIDSRSRGRFLMNSRKCRPVIFDTFHIASPLRLWQAWMVSMMSMERAWCPIKRCWTYFPFRVSRYGDGPGGLDFMKTTKVRYLSGIILCEKKIRPFEGSKISNNNNNKKGRNNLPLADMTGKSQERERCAGVESDGPFKDGPLDVFG